MQAARRLGWKLALVLLLAWWAPRWWCGRDAAAWLRGDASVQAPLARVVAARALRPLGPATMHTGSELFDGEWALVANVATALGLGQTLRAHPELTAELLPGLRAAVRNAMEPRARAFGTHQWGEDGFEALASEHGHAYLGYLGMALGMQRLVDPAMAPSLRAQHDALVEAFARRLAAAPHALVETYPGQTFPADVSSVAAAVALHARATGARRGEVLARWVRGVRSELTDPRTGLLWQTADPATGAPTGAARGSGTALVGYFGSFVDAELARSLDRALATRARADFAGFGGVRETPAGQPAASDMDSGPVLFGVSVSATGFALAGARMFRDEARFTELLRTAHLFGAPLAHRGGRSYLLGDPLGDALLLALLTAETPTRAAESL